MSDARINDPDSGGPGAEFANPDSQDPETVSSGDSETGIRSADGADAGAETPAEGG